MKKITLTLLFLFALLTIKAQVPQSERDALIALYNATDGDNWAINTNWNTTEPVSTWYGVTVENINGEDHVTELSLRYNDLNGYLPPEIGNLTSLTVLYLYSNQLSEEIPTEIGNLTNLEIAYFSSNQFTGNIPDSFANLTKLTRLSFYNNQMSGEVPELNNLSLLNYLGLAYNNFHFADLEPQLNNLIALTDKNNGRVNYIPMNPLEEELHIDMVAGEDYTFTMPEVRGTNVTYQWYHNDEPIEGATDLTYSITDAQESDLGDYTCKASSPIITDLTIDRNPIHLYGTINQTDKNALIDLYNSTDGDNWIDNTNWNTSEPVHTWYGISVVGDRVTEIDLSNNDLNGTLPSSIGDLSELKKLNIYNSNGYNTGKTLSGNIPIEIRNLNKLEYLNLAFHKLSGNIPAELGNLTTLTYLSLWFNELTGEIPTELGNLVNLETISLENNQLTGAIPESFANCTKMGSFWLNGNQLSGDVPDIFSAMPDLYYVSLGFSYGDAHQQLTGNVDLSHNPNLKGVWMSNLDISSIDLRNSNNSIITSFHADSNPNLTCIYVDDADYCTTNWNNIDAQTKFVETEAECQALSSPEFETNLIRVYPNPAHNIINIENNGMLIQKINLYNLEGQELQEFTNQNQIDISHLTNGVYLLKITDQNNKIGTYKIVKK